MIAIHTLNNDGVINSNTITQNNSQTNYEAAAPSPSAAAQPDDCDTALSHNTPIIRFAGKRGQKIDLYRVIIALLENGFFTDNNGAKPTQKEVFEAFGQMLASDFSDFQKILSQSRLCNNDSDAPTRIFDQLKATIEEYYESV